MLGWRPCIWPSFGATFPTLQGIPIASQVGAVVRYVNKSKQGEVKFAYLGAFVALLVCMAGNLLVECVQISMVYNIHVIDLVQQMNLDNALRIRSEPLQVIDVALYC